MKGRRRTNDERAETIAASGMFDAALLGDELAEAVAEAGQTPERVYLTWRKFWPRMTSALFQGRYYVEEQVTLKKPRNPLEHYLRRGFRKGLNPSPLVDIDYIVQQVAPDDVAKDPMAFDSFKKQLLSKYEGLPSLLIDTNCDPNPFFDNEYYRRRNDLAEVGPIPVVHYVQCQGRSALGEYLETTPFASMKYYMESHPDLVGANVTPLMHLLHYGLREGRTFNDGSSVNPAFLKNTATLFGDPRLLNIPEFANRCRTTGQLAGPTWPTPYSEERIPALRHQAPEAERAVTVGVVLFGNSDDQLTRLRRSLEHERQEHAEYKIDVLYWANDPEHHADYERVVGQEVLLADTRDNVGFGRAHNALMKRAFTRGHLYIGANPDGYFVPGCIKALVDFDSFWQGDALVEASAMPIDHPKWHDPISFDTQWVSGACFSLNRKLWLSSGGFDPRIHLYCEDVDLSWRVRLAGGSLKVCPTARFYHDVTPRFIEKPTSDESTRRKQAMLAGDYYLSTKWGDEKRAEKMRKELQRLLDHDPAAALTEPSYRVDAPHAAKVADFDNARFAPSRFW